VAAFVALLDYVIIWLRQKPLSRKGQYSKLRKFVPNIPVNKAWPLAGFQRCENIFPKRKGMTTKVVAPVFVILMV